MSSPILHPQWLQLEQSIGTRPILKGTPEEIMAQYNSLMTQLAAARPPPSASVVTKDLVLEGIKCRVFTPAADAQDGPPPLGIYTHGGGFVCGDLNSEDAVCRALAQHVPCVLVSVDYRLGPQYKLPSMLEDTLTVYRWVWSNASQFGGDPSRFFSIGGSAGGGLALSLANHFAQHPEGRKYIKGIVAITPVALHWDNVPSEYKEVYRSYDENAVNVPIIDKATMETFYAAVDANPSDSNIFTGLSRHHKNFPPTYICTCGADPLRDDGRIMEMALAKAGVPTKSTQYSKLPHYFWVFSDLEVSKEFISDLIAGTQWVISEMA